VCERVVRAKSDLTIYDSVLSYCQIGSQTNLNSLLSRLEALCEALTWVGFGPEWVC